MLWLLLVAAISPTCGSPAYFNRTAAAAENKPDEVVASLALKPGMSVADLGAGGGYFAIRFGKAVGPDGLVFAIDVDPKYNAFVRDEATKAGLRNVRPVLVKPGENGLKPASVDLIFSRNVFHHLAAPRVDFLRELATRLRTGGRVVFIENTPKGASISGHGTDPATIQEEMRRAGFRLSGQKQFLLPRQSYLIFEVAR